MITYEIEDAKKEGMKVGMGVMFVDTPNFGSEPYLISIGDGTTISFDVAFVNHDGATRVLRNLPKYNPQTVIYGQIKIGNNCFVGARSTILPGVTVGDNVIIGAGSLVNRDIPSNSVACGVPCRVICTIDEYADKHKNDFEFMVNLPQDQKKDYLLRKFKND